MITIPELSGDGVLGITVDELNVVGIVDSVVDIVLGTDVDTEVDFGANEVTEGRGFCP